jgi:ATP-dependent protease ClpP protease subunit
MLRNSDKGSKIKFKPLQISKIISMTTGQNFVKIEKVHAVKFWAKKKENTKHGLLKKHGA